MSCCVTNLILILETKVDPQLYAPHCQQEKILSDHNSFQITPNTITMLSKTNQNCDQNFVDIGAFSLVNSDWEEFENESEKKTFQTILLQ